MSPAKSGCADPARDTRGEIMTVRIDFAAESEIDDHDYDRWLDTLTGASVRLDLLQTAVTEVRHLCESPNPSGEQILEVLDRLHV
jgi:hypothetical protein